MSDRARLRLAEAPTAADAALRELARALLPHFRELLEAERDRDAWVDVVTYAKLPKRSTMAACRRGEIAGAAKKGRTWIAPRAAVDAWLRERGPRVVAGGESDRLDALRASLVGGR